MNAQTLLSCEQAHTCGVLKSVINMISRLKSTKKKENKPCTI